MNEKSISNYGNIMLLPFILIFFDSLFAYFLRPKGIYVTGNYFVPVLLIFIVVKYGLKSFDIRPSVFFWLCVFCFSLILGILTADNSGMGRLNEAAGVFFDFISGYVLFRNVRDYRVISNLFIFVVGVYVLVCIIALLGINPAYFPVVNAKWFELGYGLVYRPKITADQNMQIYYLFPVLLAFIGCKGILRLIIVCSVSLGGLYILIKLQTRSGILVYMVAFFLVNYVSMKYEGYLSIFRMFFFGFLFLALGLFYYDKILDVLDPLLHRFHAKDIATGNGRLGSSLYLFEHLFDPLWWVPRGSSEFLKLYGGLPHSNMTAIFLEAGLFGLIAWFFMIVIPVIKLAKRFFQGKLDLIANGVLIACLSALVLQLSLNNPVFDQIWLWAGASAGVIQRLSLGKVIFMSHA